MAAFNALGDAVAASLKGWQGESAAPAAKRRASAEASGSASEPPAAGGKRPGKGHSSNPLTPDQSVWLRGALQDSLGAFGTSAPESTLLNSGQPGSKRACSASSVASLRGSRTPQR